MYRLDPQHLIDVACSETGLDDFGEGDEWREGLERLVVALNDEASLSELGREVVKIDLGVHLRNRLAIKEEHRRSSVVANGAIRAPVVIIGQARTGTTILFDLLGQDPMFRMPLTWEVDRPIPPPTTATYRTDPRIGEVQAQLEASELLIPGFLSMHVMGATLGQECVRITGGEFRSMIFPTQWRIPSYGQWLIDEADLASTYRYHRQFLQVLGSQHPGDTWLLKSPGHLWSLRALLGEYPDARLIQTHRDPLATVASVSSLIALLRQMVTDEIDIVDIGHEWSEWILEGFARSIDARRDGLISTDQIIDVPFDRFVAEPLHQVRRIYEHFEWELQPDTEHRMREFLLENHRAKHGRHRYRFSDTGLDVDALRERTAEYVQTYEVTLTALD